MSTFENGVDQLIERVKSEGLDKAAIAAAEILKKAHNDAQNIMKLAHSQAEKLIREAKQQSIKERQALEIELRLAARDFSLKLTDRLRAQWWFPSIKESVRITLKQPDFLAEILKRLVLEYIKENPGSIDVLVPKELKTTLAAYLASHIFDQLDKKCDVSLKDEAGLEGFVLVKRGEHYVWDFRVDTVAEELMRLVEPSLKKYFMSIKPVVSDTSQLSTV